MNNRFRLPSFLPTDWTGFTEPVFAQPGDTVYTYCPISTKDTLDRDPFIGIPADSTMFSFPRTT